MATPSAAASGGPRRRRSSPRSQIAITARATDAVEPAVVICHCVEGGRRHAGSWVATTSAAAVLAALSSRASITTAASGAVELAGRLVGEHQARVGSTRARANGDTLGLAAR